MAQEQRLHIGRWCRSSWPSRTKTGGGDDDGGAENSGDWPRRLASGSVDGGRCRTRRPGVDLPGLLHRAFRRCH